MHVYIVFKDGGDVKEVSLAHTICALIASMPPIQRQTFAREIMLTAPAFNVNEGKDHTKGPIVNISRILTA